MQKGLHYKSKQFFFVLIKLSIVVGAFYFIYQKLLNNDALNFNQFLDFLKKNNLFTAQNCLLLLFLTSINWSLEILKWRFLISKLKKISFKEASKQSLGALTTSLLTPNRIGEYGAKALYYKKSQRKHVVLLNLISNLMQMGITILLGAIGLYIFYQKYELNINYIRLSRGIIFLLTIVGLSVLGIRQTRFKVKGFSIQKIRKFTFNLSLKYTFIGLFYSLFRYAIFSFQFYYILTLLGVNIQYSEALIIITSLYLLASIIPTISIFDVVIKGSVAIYLFGLASFDELPVLSTTLLMWLLNFALPSSIGCYYVLTFKFKN